MVNTPHLTMASHLPKEDGWRDKFNELATIINNNNTNLRNFHQGIMSELSGAINRAEYGIKINEEMAPRLKCLEDELVSHRQYIRSLLEAVQHDIKGLSDHCPNVLKVVSEISINESGILEEAKAMKEDIPF